MIVPLCTFFLPSPYTGQLTAECRGPSGNSVPIAVEPTSASRVRLLQTPCTSGEHLVYLQYGGFPLPHSPLLGIADGGSGASSGPVRVVLTGRGLAGARCHEEAEFTIDGSQAGSGTFHCNGSDQAKLPPLRSQNG